MRRGGILDAFRQNELSATTFQLGIAQNQELCWDFSMYHEVPIGTLPDCRGDIMCQEHVRGQQGWTRPRDASLVSPVHRGSRLAWFLLWDTEMWAWRALKHRSSSPTIPVVQEEQPAHLLLSSVRIKLNKFIFLAQHGAGFRLLRAPHAQGFLCLSMSLSRPS